MLDELRQPKQWRIIILALVIGILIGTLLIPQLSSHRQRDFAIYSRHLQSTHVGPFDLTFHRTPRFVTADVTLTGKKSAELNRLYVEAGTSFSQSQNGQMSSVEYQRLNKYGTLEGTLPVTLKQGHTKHVRLFSIPSNYSQGKVTGYMIDLGYN